jgi:hypothetical protein
VNKVLLGSLRYFGFGEKLRQTGEANEQFRTVSPNEFAIDGSYSFKIKRNILHGSSRKIHPFKLKSNH